MALGYSRLEYRFVILLPILNAIATVLTDYFGDQSINIGQIRAFIILSYSFYFILSGKIIQNSLSKILLFTLIYFFILVLYSSNFSYSFQLYLKYYIATFLFFIGNYFGKNPNFINDISKSILIMLFLYLSNFVISNIFGLGFTSYKGVENQLYFGVSGVNLAKHISVLLLLFPILNIYKQNFFWLTLSKVLFFGGIIFILFAFKRSAILTLTLGYLVYFFIMRDLKSLKNILIFSLVFLFISPLIIDQISDNFNARSEAIYLNDSENLDKQARFTEFQLVTESIQENGTSYFLFGAEIFNDMSLFRNRRMLHTDYMTILSGSGIIGFSFFMFFYLKMYLRSRIKYFKQEKDFYKLFHAVTCSLIVSLLILGFAGNIHAIEPRGTIFLFLGILYGSKFNYRYFKK